MAYLKIQSIKTAEHLQSSIDYICNKNKTEGIYIYGYMCNPENVPLYFNEVSENAVMKKGNIIANHIVQSFAPEDDISPQKAFEIAQTFMEKALPDHQYILATHTDKEYIHNHIILNSVNFKTFRKLRNNIRLYNEMVKIDRELCKENGLTVIQENIKECREIMKNDIDECVANTDNFEDFLTQMKLRDYEVKLEPKLAFKGTLDERFRRSETIGNGYSELAIKQRLKNIIIDTEQSKTIYTKNNKKTSNRKRLIIAIDEALKESTSFEEFLEIMHKNGSEIKRGKHLAIKLPYSERFIRLRSLKEEYSEEMLRLYFDNKSLYNERKTAIEKSRISAVNTSEENKYSKYTAAYNLDVEIRMVNMLKQNGINSLVDFKQQQHFLQEKLQKAETEVKQQSMIVDEKREIIKAIRNYWRLKPVNEKYKKISIPADKDRFATENKKFLAEFKTAVDIINRHKLPDGTLPKADEINTAIAEATEKVEQGRERLRQLKDELYKYSIIEDNLRHLGIEDKDISFVQSDEILK
ncbi:MAG: relaxase/mobilization nuclease domain-containing protein [Firmicutes bacterium]|nr:relaxase/mobilization nuclease domain-containing protein [Bacillota bacterium]